jgi:SET domain-containing protein
MKAAMINHQPPPDDNVELRWFSWLKSQQQDPFQLVKSFSASQLLRSRSVLLDVGFYAKRPIAKGEELFYHYGLTWENAWEQAACHMYDQRGCWNISNFRSYIEVPEGFFPHHWR